jgi:dihydroflavonol-4-reductase
MSGPIPSSHMRSALVTGATGLLGNNLVRALAARGVRVKALARSRDKARQQLAGLAVDIIEGDMDHVAAFAPALEGVDTLFHTAAYFRESFNGTGHDVAATMQRINVEGTVTLLKQAREAGVRRVVHTSSTEVLFGPRGALVDETMRREERHANDYGVSKIRGDRAIDRLLETTPDLDVRLVLPGWMFGPGDLGPTPAGQFTLDFVQRKLPGIPPGTFAVTDARDVAETLIAAALHGRRGERYIAAGPQLSMKELCVLLERVSGVKKPARELSVPMLFVVAGVLGTWARLRRRPALVNLETARLVALNRDRARYDLTKTTRELGVTFRPVEETLRDTLTWYRDHGWLPQPEATDGRPALAGR